MSRLWLRIIIVNQYFINHNYELLFNLYCRHCVFEFAPPSQVTNDKMTKLAISPTLEVESLSIENVSPAQGLFVSPTKGVY